MFAYQKLAFQVVWKCLKSLCGGGGGWVLKVNLVIDFGLRQGKQFKFDPSTYDILVDFEREMLCSCLSCQHMTSFSLGEK